MARAELADALIRTAVEYAGPDSATTAWVRQQLADGRNPREVAMQLKGMLRQGGSASHE